MKPSVKYIRVNWKNSQDVVKLIQCLHNELGQLEGMFQVIQVIDKKKSNLNCRSKYSCSSIIVLLINFQNLQKVASGLCLKAYET